MKTGIELIAHERLEQIEKHGFTTETDKTDNNEGELNLLIKYLLLSDNDAEKDNLKEYFVESGCYNMSYIAKFDTKTIIEKLTIAGALIAAEIDRLQ